MYYHEEQVKAILDALKATSDKVNIFGVDCYVVSEKAFELPKEIMKALATKPKGDK